VLLIRREPGKQVDLNQFKPAEWRWALPQVCDGEWHHYAINVGLPDVSSHYCKMTIINFHLACFWKDFTVCVQ